MAISCCNDDEHVEESARDLNNAERSLIPYKENDSILFIDNNGSDYWLYCKNRIDSSTKSPSQSNYKNCSVVTVREEKFLKAELKTTIINPNCNQPVNLLIKIESYPKTVPYFGINFRSDISEMCAINDNYGNKMYYSQLVSGKLENGDIVNSGFISQLYNYQLKNKIYNKVYGMKLSTATSLSFIDSGFYAQQVGIIKITTTTGAVYTIYN